jgi:putative hydrolase of the HAD superfamily
MKTKIKGILLDIDNTLYDYKHSHSFAKKRLIDYCSNRFNLPKDLIISSYEKGRLFVHIELSETAASHNRLLYIQKMLEILNLNPTIYAMDIYNIYWDSFLEHLIPFDGIYLFLEKFKNNICLLTDLTAHIQYRKIKKLGLEKYCDKLVTSEETGREKPHPYMFMLGLKKLNLKPNEVCMIGDSFKKDILGAVNLGINAIWLNHDGIKESTQREELITEVNSFNEIIEII